jgi:hypothetical protein
MALPEPAAESSHTETLVATRPVVGARFPDIALPDHTGRLRGLSEVAGGDPLVYGYWFWGRPTHGELRRDLREITSLIRDDWVAERTT